MNAFSPETDFRKEIVVLGVSAFLMAISASYIPFFGLLLASLSPAPLIILFFFLGRKAGLLVASVIFGAISLFLGTAFGALFILQYGVLGLVIGEAIRMNYSVMRILSLGSAVPPFVWFVVLGIFLVGSGASLFTVVETVIQANIENTIQLYKNAGLDFKHLEIIKREPSAISRLVIGALPSVLLISSFFSAFINYSLARWAVKKRYGIKWRRVQALKEFLIPDYLVWGLILGAFLTLASPGVLRLLGVNTSLVMLILYCVQGFAVVSFFLNKWGFSSPAKIFVYFILGIQPLTLILVTVLGLFDIWLDIRKIRANKPEVV
ncbi:MAG: DUF2232 domain-containing protein [Nitrospinota bacterium]